MRAATRCLVVLILFSMLVVTSASRAPAQERITSFSSSITVNQDATMVVQETIKVVCEQNQIKHGIYRDFPTRYKDRLGNNVVVDFEVLSVMRDGLPEPYHFGGMSNGIRIYIGDPQVYVSTGEHTYAITYKTSRQFGFFKDRDELYWNVTGNGWVFPIDKAQATITLPAGIAASSITVDGWTGPQDSKAKNLQAWVDSSGRPSFRTTAPLGPEEGLTILASWPKGFVTVPTGTERFRWLLQDNRNVLICVAGLFAVIAYFTWAQMKVGIDPARGAIVPQWDPPDGLPPAAIRYISGMHYDNKTLSCALIDAAVRGHIEINEEGGEYTIKRKADGKVALSPEELLVVEGLLRSGDSIVLKQSNNATIRGAIGRFSDSLKSQFGNGYFATHIGYSVLGVLLSGATLALALFSDPLGGKIPLFVAGFLLLLVCIIFSRLLRAYTRRGRQLMDKVEGMRLYMRVAEQERLNVLNPPDRTPELFEKLLPYALALGVEHEWSEQFADVLAKAQAEGYHPAWYVGPAFYTGAYAGFASSLGNSFSSAISSSAVAPGSSSGGGGGGSSGGGGGGGGGGGW